MSLPPSTNIECDFWLGFANGFLRDVAAGIAILEEAGGLVTTANPPSDPDTAEIPAMNLGGRSYLAIRYVDSEMVDG